MTLRILAAAVLLTTAPLASARELTDLLSCLRGNLPDALQVEQLEFKTVDADGTPRTLETSMLTQREKGLWRALLRVESPRDLRGLSYLLREEFDADAVYTYAPGLDAARRVALDEMDGSLFGTAFSYRDFQAALGVWQNAQIVLHPQARSGAPYETVSVFPEGTHHRVEILAEVDARHCVVLRADVREDGMPSKRLRADPATIRSAGTFWYAGTIELRDLRNGASTVLQMGGVNLGRVGVWRNFSPATFFLAH